MNEYLHIINKFVREMNYDKNPHFLGIYFYGSSLTGFANENSDIDLHIVFDNANPTHIYRGVHYIEGKRIEYFEKCISDLYLSVDAGIKERNIAWYSIIVCSKILCDKECKLKQLREYTIGVYEKGLPKLDEQDIMEYISIIDNRMDKLRIACDNDEPYFYHLYQITIEKIRRFYHAIKGLPKINTSKIYKVYKNDEYRKTYYPGEFVSKEFKDMYFSLIEDTSQDKKTLLKNLENFYLYVKDGRSFQSKNFNITIKSRNIK